MKIRIDYLPTVNQGGGMSPSHHRESWMFIRTTHQFKTAEADLLHEGS